ncbi:hypothetical protein [Sorangium sp. So ce385]|uniref:hypothetical protein n=1 Tax=Sorangium sp. So ce385 TaxID=3133308 RepID=UPI003F5BD848
MLIIGCDEIPFPPFQGGWGDGDAPSGSGGSAADPDVIAMRAGDVSFPPDIEPLIPPADDPDALVLFFSSVVQQCADPWVSVTCDTAPIWQFILVVPAELLTDGLIDLSDSRISYYEELAYPGCWGTGAGGSGFRGTLEIVSSDDASLFVKLRGAANEDLSLDGDYTVDRCGAATVPAPDE